MININKIRSFNPKQIMDAINKLIDAVQALQPRKSSGTLQTHSSGGTLTRAAGGANKGSTTINTADDRPARWQ